ncbi:unnamed protein product, partial [marine sediment metagenome]
DWTVTSGVKHEFDTVLGSYNSLVQVDSAHYLNTYMGADSDGFAVVLTVELEGAPSVFLNSPIDNYETDSASVTFNCTASDDINLTSVALYHSCGQSWGVDGINLTPINDSPITFSKTLSDCVNAKWNCYACDNESKCGFAESDRTFTIDSTSPTYSNNQTNSTTFGKIELCFW